MHRHAHKDPRQKHRKVERKVLQHPQKRGKHRCGSVIVQTLELLAEQSGQHQRRGAAVDQNYQLALAELGGGDRRALGVVHRGEQPRLAGQQPRHEITGIQQQFRPCTLQNGAHPLYHGGVCTVLAVAKSILCIAAGVRLCGLLHKGIGTDKAAQKAQIHPQKVGKAFPAAAQIALGGWLFHGAEFEPLH